MDTRAQNNSNNKNKNRNSLSLSFFLFLLTSIFVTSNSSDHPVQYTYITWLETCLITDNLQVKSYGKINKIKPPSPPLSLFIIITATSNLLHLHLHLQHLVRENCFRVMKRTNKSNFCRWKRVSYKCKGTLGADVDADAANNNNNNYTNRYKAESNLNT